jgi:hypothetical protein
MTTTIQGGTARQGGFYSNGTIVVRVEETSFFDLTVTHKLFGEMRRMSWEAFKEYTLIPAERWKDVK